MTSIPEVRPPSRRRTRRPASRTCWAHGCERSSRSSAAASPPPPGAHTRWPCESRTVGSRRALRRPGPGASTARDRGRARLPRVLRPKRAARPGCLRPLRAAHDRGGPRRPRRGPDRAGAGVSPGGHLRGGAPRPAPGDPGDRGQELLLPRGRRVPLAAPSRPQGRGVHPGRVVERRSGSSVRFPQGGSTLTQQLVRGYFLQDDTRRENGNLLLRDGLALRLVSVAVGVPRPTSCGGSSRRSASRSGSRADATAIWVAGQAGDLRPLRELHLSGQRPLRLRRRVRVLLRQAAGELHGGGRGEGGAARGISKSPRDYAPVPERLGPCAGATRSWP